MYFNYPCSLCLAEKKITEHALHFRMLRHPIFLTPSPRYAVKRSGKRTCFVCLQCYFLKEIPACNLEMISSLRKPVDTSFSLANCKIEGFANISDALLRDVEGTCWQWVCYGWVVQTSTLSIVQTKQDPDDFSVDKQVLAKHDTYESHCLSGTTGINLDKSILPKQSAWHLR